MLAVPLIFLAPFSPRFHGHIPTPDGDDRLRTGSALALRVVTHRNYVGSGRGYIPADARLNQPGGCHGQHDQRRNNHDGADLS